MREQGYGKHRHFGFLFYRASDGGRKKYISSAHCARSRTESSRGNDTVALNGAKNAAWLAAEIIALHDERVAGLIRAEREGYKASVSKAAAELEA